MRGTDEKAIHRVPSLKDADVSVFPVSETVVDHGYRDVGPAAGSCGAEATNTATFAWAATATSSSGCSRASGSAQAGGDKRIEFNNGIKLDEMLDTLSKPDHQGEHALRSRAKEKRSQSWGHRRPTKQMSGPTSPTWKAWSGPSSGRFCPESVGRADSHQGSRHRQGAGEFPILLKKNPQGGQGRDPSRVRQNCWPMMPAISCCWAPTGITIAGHGRVFDPGTDDPEKADGLEEIRFQTV